MCAGPLFGDTAGTKPQKLFVTSKPIGEPLGMVGQLLGMSTLCAPTWGIPCRGVFFCKILPGTPNAVFVHVFCVLQIQFCTGIRYIDAH